jgi:hypothetical protein
MASAPAIVPALAGIEQGDHLLGLAGVTFDTAFELPGAVNIRMLEFPHHSLDDRNQ